jgi:hypothetical protein
MPWRILIVVLGTGSSLACGPATNGAEEPIATPSDAGADAAVDAQEAVPVVVVPPDHVGPLPGPPGEDPPGFEAFAPLPDGGSLTRALWRIEGVLSADELREGIGSALGEIATCLANASGGGRLPMHVIVGAEGRVAEVGAPLAEAGLREAITCAQVALRAFRFPESAGDTTVHLIVER